MVTHLVGRTLESVFPKEEVALGDVHLEVRGFTRKGAYEDVNFTVRKGEILGLAGLVGAGRTEISRGIFGLDPVDSGEILIGGKPVRSGARRCHEARIAYVPEDRTREGAISGPADRLQPFAGRSGHAVLLRSDPGQADRELADDYIKRLGVRTSGPDQLISALSGGNQQKVVLGKWLATNPEILILDDPTKGVDVGAKSEVYKIVGENGPGRNGDHPHLQRTRRALWRSPIASSTFYRGPKAGNSTERPFDAEAVLASMTGQVSDVA